MSAARFASNAAHTGRALLFAETLFLAGSGYVSASGTRPQRRRGDVVAARADEDGEPVIYLTVFLAALRDEVASVRAEILGFTDMLRDDLQPSTS